MFTVLSNTRNANLYLIVAVTIVAVVLLAGCSGILPAPATATSTADPTGIEGRVYRSDTDESFANASVELSDAAKEAEDPNRTVAKTTTDQEGRYSFAGIQPGGYTLNVPLEFVNASDSPCKLAKLGPESNLQSSQAPLVSRFTYTSHEMMFGARAAERDGGGLELNAFTMLVSEVAAGDLVTVDIDLKCQ